MGARCLRCLCRRSSWARRSRCCAEVGGQRRRRSDGRGGKAAFARSCFPRVSARCWRQRHHGRSRRHAGCPLAGVVFSFEVLRRARLVCFAGRAGVTSLIVLGRGTGDGRALSSGFRCGAGRIGRRLRDSFTVDQVAGALLLLAAVGAAGLRRLLSAGSEKLPGRLARGAPVFALAVGEWPRRSSSAMRIFSTMRTCARTAVRAFQSQRRLWRGGSALVGLHRKGGAYAAHSCRRFQGAARSCPFSPSAPASAWWSSPLRRLFSPHLFWALWERFGLSGPSSAWSPFSPPANFVL